MVGVLGGNLAIAPIVSAGDSVIRPREVIQELVTTPEPEIPIESMSESVTVGVT